MDLYEPSTQAKPRHTTHEMAAQAEEYEYDSDDNDSSEVDYTYDWDQQMEAALIRDLPEAKRLALASIFACGCSIAEDAPANRSTVAYCAWADDFIRAIAVDFLQLPDHCAKAAELLLRYPAGGERQSPEAFVVAWDAATSDTGEDMTEGGEALAQLLLLTVATARYTAYARVAFRRAADALGVPWGTVASHEARISSALRSGLALLIARQSMREEAVVADDDVAARRLGITPAEVDRAQNAALLAPQQLHHGDVAAVVSDDLASKDRRRKQKRFWRRVKIGGAAFVGATALAVSAGMAAPAIGAGLVLSGSMIGVEGAALTATGGFLATAEGVTMLPVAVPRNS